MEAHLQKTVDDLLEKLRGLEKQVADTRRLVNSLCELGGAAPMFAVIDDAPTLTAIKADTFYGQPFATAAAVYLRMRKATNMGPATVNDIYDALKLGGYQFDAKNEDYAKRGVRHSLSKNTATFHKVPNGEFGLLEWYPDVKRKPRTSTNTSANTDGASDDADDDDDDDDDVSAVNAETIDDADDETTPDDADNDLDVPWKEQPPKGKPMPVKPVGPKDAVAKPIVGKIVNGRLVSIKPATKADV